MWGVPPSGVVIHILLAAVIVGFGIYQSLRQD